MFLIDSGHRYVLLGLFLIGLSIFLFFFLRIRDRQRGKSYKSSNKVQSLAEARSKIGNTKSAGESRDELRQSGGYNQSDMDEANKAVMRSRGSVFTRFIKRRIRAVVLLMMLLVGAWYLVLGMFLASITTGLNVASLYTSVVLTTECSVNTEGKVTSADEADNSSSNSGVSSDDLGQGKFTEQAEKWAKGFEFTFIGDSLGVGVEPDLKGYFPKSNFNSYVGRMFTNPSSQLSGVETLRSMVSSNEVKSVLVIALGTNQPPTDALMDKMVAEAPKSTNIVWVNTASEGGGGGMNKVDHDAIASTIKSYASSHSQAYLDWNKYVAKNLKWSDITADTVHMTSEGYSIYAKFITQGLYDYLGKTGVSASVAERGSSKSSISSEGSSEGSSEESESSSSTDTSSSSSTESSDSSDDSSEVSAVSCKKSDSSKSDDTSSSDSSEGDGGGAEDGTGEYPADATAWAYKPDDIPASLKAYIIDPKKYGMAYGSATGWLRAGDQCVDLTESLGGYLWFGTPTFFSGNGIDQTASASSLLGSSIQSKPIKGAIFSDNDPYAGGYGHTGVVCHVFKDGSILAVEQNVTGMSGQGNGTYNTWSYRHYTTDAMKSYGMNFAYKGSPKLK